MEVYLVQHGESKSETEDPERPLTDRGREEVDAVARRMADLGIEVVQVVHSSKLRAKQTAELFAQHLVPPQGIAQRESLAPLDDPDEAKDFVSRAQEPLMIVGHLPHLSRLASLLVLGKAEREIVKFKMGAVVCLVRSGETWSVDWAFVPAFARQRGRAEAREKGE